MGVYADFRDRQQKEYNALPIRYAFNDEQLAEAMDSLGSHNKKDYYTSGPGSIYLKKDAPFIRETMQRLDRELREALAGSYEFAYDAFYEELSNHEYCITLDPEPVLDALGIFYNEKTGCIPMAEKYPHIRKAWNAAKRKYLTDAEKNGWCG